MGPGPLQNRTTTGLIRRPYPGPSTDKGAGGEIRSRDMLSQIVNRDIWVIDHGNKAVHHLG